MVGYGGMRQLADRVQRFRLGLIGIAVLAAGCTNVAEGRTTSDGGAMDVGKDVGPGRDMAVPEDEGPDLADTSRDAADSPDVSPDARDSGTAIEVEFESGVIVETPLPHLGTPRL